MRRLVDEAWQYVVSAALTGYDKLVGLVSRNYQRNGIHQPTREGLSLLLPPPCWPATMQGMGVLDKVLEGLDDMSSHILLCLHHVTKHRKFWKSRAQGHRNDKLVFMIVERGPWAFLQGLAHLRSGTDRVVMAASLRIGERISMLSMLQCRIAALLAQIHKEVDKLGDELEKGQGRPAVTASLMCIHKSMRALDGLYNLPEDDFHGAGDVSTAATIKIDLDDVSERLSVKSEWSDDEIQETLGLLRSNLEKLEEGLTILMMGYRRPRKILRHWLRYTCEGSDDMDVWLKEGLEAVRAFLKEHVEQPALSIRDELFETFRKRHRGAVELADVQLTAESLRRMLIDFAEHATGEKVDKSLSEQLLMEQMMVRYENELPHPLRNLFTGDLVHALLIQVQKLKLDIETAMLELNQILHANEINFAILAGLPALLFLFLLVQGARLSLSQRKGAEGRGRAAQLYRRMLTAEAGRKVVSIQVSLDKGKEDEGHWQFGMLLYTLDRLSRAVKKAATSSGEWKSLREDILELAKPRLATVYKLAITGRMERVYECLIPVPKT